MSEYLNGQYDEYERSGGEKENILAVLVQVVEQRWSHEEILNWLERDYKTSPSVNNLLQKQKRKVKKNKRRR